MFLFHLIILRNTSTGKHACCKNHVSGVRFADNPFFFRSQRANYTGKRLDASTAKSTRFGVGKEKRYERLLGVSLALDFVLHQCYVLYEQLSGYEILL